MMARYRDRHLDGTLIEGDWHEIKLGVVGAWQDGPARVAIRFHRRTATQPERDLGGGSPAGLTRFPGWFAARGACQAPRSRAAFWPQGMPRGSLQARHPGVRSTNRGFDDGLFGRRLILGRG